MGTVWVVFWITFQLGWLVGFVLIDIASFKLTQDQMAFEAAMLLETLTTYRMNTNRFPPAFFISALPPGVAHCKRHCDSFLHGHFLYHFIGAIDSLATSLGLLLFVHWYGHILFATVSGLVQTIVMLRIRWWRPHQCAATSIVVIRPANYTHRG